MNGNQNQNRRQKNNARNSGYKERKTKYTQLKNQQKSKETLILNQAQTDLQSRKGQPGYNPNFRQTANSNKFNLGLSEKLEEINQFEQQEKNNQNIPQEFSLDLLKQNQQQTNEKYLQPIMLEDELKQRFQLRYNDVAAKVTISLDEFIENLTNSFRQTFVSERYYPVQVRNSQQEFIRQIMAYAICIKLSNSSKDTTVQRDDTFMSFFHKIGQLMLPNAFIQFIDQIGDFDSQYGRFIITDKPQLIRRLIHGQQSTYLTSNTSIDIIHSLVKNITFVMNGISFTMSDQPINNFMVLQKQAFQTAILRAKFPAANQQQVQDMNVLLRFLLEDPYRQVNFSQQNLALLTQLGVVVQTEQQIKDAVQIRLQWWNLYVTRFSRDYPNVMQTYIPTSTGTCSMLTTNVGNKITSAYSIQNIDAFSAYIIKPKAIITQQEFPLRETGYIEINKIVKTQD